jgi:periplasmic divalent cation tolerance protein
MSSRSRAGKAFIVFCTVPTHRIARHIAKRAVEKRLAACVNILSGVTSYFRWEGKVDRASELLLVMKTRSALFKRLASEIKAAHPYDVPEIVGFPISLGWAPYLRWLADSTKREA